MIITMFATLIFGATLFPIPDVDSICSCNWFRSTPGTDLEWRLGTCKGIYKYSSNAISLKRVC